MPRITVGTENNAPIEIHYEDHGSGDPVVMVHGYPLDGNSWERQERELLAQGFRVITYDRRGFGRSSQPTVGYDYNTFAADLNDLLEHLDLRDVVLVGFSMGTGEVTRYLGTYGSSRVRRAALLAALPPFLLKTDDNPEGVDRQVFDDIKAAIVKDRYAYFKDFFDNFYNVDKFMPDRISEPAWQASFAVAAASSPFATYACVDTWLTDFRRDLPKIDVPVLVVHGTEDRILPYASTAARLPALLDDVTLVPIEGGPHNIAWTHPDEVNRALLDFVRASPPDRASLVSNEPTSAPTARSPSDKLICRNAVPDTVAGWKALTDGLLTSQCCAFHRNVEISSRYAWIYGLLPACLKWAGMAAIASHHVRLGLFPLRLDADRTGYVDIPRSLGRRSCC